MWILFYFIFFSVAQQPAVNQGLLTIEASRSHTDTPYSVELLWTNDQPVAEIPTWQYTTLTTDRHPCPGGIRKRNPGKREAADSHLIPRVHRDQRVNILNVISLSVEHFLLPTDAHTPYRSQYAAITLTKPCTSFTHLLLTKRVTFSQVLTLAPWRWFPYRPKHVGAFLFYLF